MLEILKRILLAPRAAFDVIQKGLNELSLFFKEAVIKVKNLSQTNYDLGLLHISRGNIIDAKFRFILVTRFNKDFLDSEYQLARCYIYLGDIKKAKSILKKLSHCDKSIFRLNILNNKPIKNIPIDVVREDFDYLAHQYAQLCEDSKYNAIDLILEDLTKTNAICENFNILDIGSANGMLGYNVREISDQLELQNLTIDAIDISMNMINNIEDFHHTTLPEIYNNKYQHNFLTWKNSINYDIIIASCSLCYETDLSKSFSILKKLMNNKAKAIIILETSIEQKFCYSSGHFLFSKDDIKQAAKDANLIIEDIRDIQIQSNTKGAYISLRN